jgi:hypothetical protein
MKNTKQRLDFDVNTNGQERTLSEENHPKMLRLTEKKSESDQRIFYLAVIAIVFSFAAFSFSGFNAKTPGHHAFVVVDINQLLRQKATDIVKNQTDKKAETQNEIQLAEHAKHIRSVIETYARDKNVIVLMKGTAFGVDVTEVTDEISTRF